MHEHAVTVIAKHIHLVTHTFRQKEGLHAKYTGCLIIMDVLTFNNMFCSDHDAKLHDWPVVTILLLGQLYYNKYLGIFMYLRSFLKS